MSPIARSPSRQAWLILVSGFLAFTVSASLMHAYTVFLLAFVEEFHWVVRRAA